MSKLFRLFSGDPTKHGKGITKQQVERDKKMGISFFFKLLKNRLGNLSSTSILFSLCNFPIFLFLFGLSRNLDTVVSAPSTPMYAQVYGLEAAGANGPFLAMLTGMFGLNATINIVSTASKVLMYSAVLLILTVGLSTLGAVYNFRSIVRCEPLSPWSEFFPALRRNLKQGIPFAILDALFMLFLGYDLIIYYSYASGSGGTVPFMLFYAVLFFSFIYYVMRYHIYLIMITFDLKLRKILKNALYLTFLGWKRSLLCLLSTIGVFLLSIYLFSLLPSFGILLPFVITFGLFGYIGVYCAYPVIETYMIEPYYREHPEELPQEEEIDSIFTDRG